MFADFDKITVGSIKYIKKTITLEDVDKFVAFTGDDNPLHVDKSFAADTTFKDIVVHGMLGASFISTVIGTRLPGAGALWMSQNFEFLLPVRLGDKLKVSCEVLKIHKRDRVLELRTTITNQNSQLVLDGLGKVKVLQEKNKENKPISLKGNRTALVTGATGGIGQAIVRKLADEGCDVCIHYNSNEDAALKLVDELTSIYKESKFKAYRADLNSEKSIFNMTDDINNDFEKIDILVNNASSQINAKSIDNLDWEDVSKHLNIQLKASIILCKTVLPEMRKSKWGRIINMSSQVVDGDPTPNWTSYAIAKSTLQTLSKYLAVEEGMNGVTVNSIAPGMCETSLIGDIPEKIQLITARKTPLRRLALPKDIADMVSFLASDKASFVTGQTMHVNGGIFS